MAENTRANGPVGEEVTPPIARALTRELLSVLAPFAGLALIYAFFGICDVWDPTESNFYRLFGTYNLKSVAAQTTTVAVAALGMTLVIISAGIDLSPGSSIALTITVIALWLKSGGGAFGALVLGVLSATVVGLVNGIVITRLRVVPFIATLGMMLVARGLAKLLAGGQRVTAPTTWLEGLLAVDASPDAPFWKVPSGLIALVVVAVLVHIVLGYTVFGRYVFAIGSNEATARLCGINVRLQKTLIYTVCGLLTGLAGALQFSYLRVGDPTAAVGKELDIIASVVIGGGSLAGGRGSVLGTIIGAFVMGVLRNGCDIYGIPNSWQEVFIGLIIVGAVSLDSFRRR